MFFLICLIIYTRSESNFSYQIIICSGFVLHPCSWICFSLFEYTVTFMDVCMS